MDIKNSTSRADLTSVDLFSVNGNTLLAPQICVLFWNEVDALVENKSGNAEK